MPLTINLYKIRVQGFANFPNILFLQRCADDEAFLWFCVKIAMYSKKTVASFFLRGVLSRRHAAVKERIKSLLHIFLGFRAYTF